MRAVCHISVGSSLLLCKHGIVAALHQGRSDDLCIMDLVEFLLAWINKQTIYEAQEFVIDTVAKRNADLAGFRVEANITSLNLYILWALYESKALANFHSFSYDATFINGCLMNIFTVNEMAIGNDGEILHDLIIDLLLERDNGVIRSVALLNRATLNISRAADENLIVVVNVHVVAINRSVCYSADIKVPIVYQETIDEGQHLFIAMLAVMLDDCFVVDIQV